MASLDDVECEFGHFKILDKDVPLDRIKNDIETRSVYNKLEKLKERCKLRPLYYQTMKTMYAAILFKAAKDSETKQESETYLLQVLKDDEENITALADITYYYEHTLDHIKAKDYSRKLKKIMNDKCDLALARAYCDKAHIIRHFEQDKRQFTYFEFLEKAKYHIGKVKRNEDSDIEIERGEIMFDYSLGLYRQYAQKTEFAILDDTEIQHSNELLGETINSFLDVIDIPKSPKDCKALSYIFIAILLRLKTSFDDKIGESTPYLEYCKRFADLNLDPCGCLAKGLSIDKTDANVLRRVASEYIHLDNLEEAEKLFEESLKEEESWFGHRHMGRLYLKMYEGSEDVKHLLSAKDSFKQAYTLKTTHADYSDHGYVCLLQAKEILSKNPRDSEAAKKLLGMAKLDFAEAVKLTDSDDYFNPIETYKRWERCLKLTDEDGGIQLLRRMSEDHGDTLASHRQSNRPTYRQLISEVSQTTHESPTYKHDFYVISCEYDQKWVIENLIPKLESEHNLKGYLHWRDREVGKYNVYARVDAMFNSRYIIVILSPNFKVSSWIKYELSFALHDAIDRLPNYKVLQIMIEQCEVPNELQPFSERLIRCNDGVIDWQRLYDFVTTQISQLKTS